MSATFFFRSIMPKAKIVEGVFGEFGQVGRLRPLSAIADGNLAIDKPRGITSAQVVRDLQHAFNPSSLFAPWMAAEQASRQRVSANQKHKRKNKRLDVKIGHGGTLDPLATGVLITGVGNGTKHLPSFLGCTKSYETVLLFGVATDTYDVHGKILSRAPYNQITRDKVEGILHDFRGAIMQRPPLYSALRVQGKRLYEYAREGKEVPREIQERPVTVEELEILDWLDPGVHEYKWPVEEAEREAKEVAEKVLHLDDGSAAQEATLSYPIPVSSHTPNATNELKRRHTMDDDDDNEPEFGLKPASKRRENGREYFMSGALQFADEVDAEISPSKTSGPAETTQDPDHLSVSDKGPPAVKLRMTVTSGFYVRSLCHDLGKALGSLGIMAELVRTRQGDFELGKNVLAYDRLGKGEDIWGPEVAEMLEKWQQRPSNKNDQPVDRSLSPGD